MILDLAVRVVLEVSDKADLTVAASIMVRVAREGLGRAGLGSPPGFTMTLISTKKPQSPALCSSH